MAVSRDVGGPNIDSNMPRSVILGHHKAAANSGEHAISALASGKALDTTEVLAEIRQAIEACQKNCKPDQKSNSKAGPCVHFNRGYIAVPLKGVYRGNIGIVGLGFRVEGYVSL